MEREQKLAKMGEIYSDWENCSRCGLCQERTKVVFGEGNPDAQLLIIGDFPRKASDLSGHPFDARYGQVIDNMLDSFKSYRDEVFLLNLLGCRTPEDRKPDGAEIKACLPRVHDIIRLVDPYVVLLLGNLALKALTKEKRSLSKLARNRNFPGIRITIPGIMVPLEYPAFVTFHPSHLLQDWKLEEGSDLHMSYQTWDKAFTVSDAYAEHYKGTAPPQRKING